MRLLKYPWGPVLPQEPHSSGITSRGDKRADGWRRGGNLSENRALCHCGKSFRASGITELPRGPSEEATTHHTRTEITITHLPPRNTENRWNTTSRQDHCTLQCHLSTAKSQRWPRPKSTLRNVNRGCVTEGRRNIPFIACLAPVVSALPLNKGRKERLGAFLPVKFCYLKFLPVGSPLKSPPPIIRSFIKWHRWLSTRCKRPPSPNLMT